MLAYYSVHIMTLTRRVLDNVKMVSLVLNRLERRVQRRNLIFQM